MGSLLFLHYRNNIAADIDTEIRLFVGDFILYRQIVDDSDRAKLQDDVNKLFSLSRLELRAIALITIFSQGVRRDYRLWASQSFIC